jgi:hypothetical protein
MASSISAENSSSTNKLAQRASGSTSSSTSTPAACSLPAKTSDSAAVFGICGMERISSSCSPSMSRNGGSLPSIQYRGSIGATLLTFSSSSSQLDRRGHTHPRQSPTLCYQFAGAGKQTGRRDRQTLACCQCASFQGTRAKPTCCWSSLAIVVSGTICNALSLCLLGPLGVTLAGEPVTGLASAKVRALLAYLAMEAERPHRRQVLAGLLWPDRPEQAARSNLRHTLAKLRKAIDDSHTTPPYLLTTRETIQFNRASDCWIDVWAFEALVAASRADDEDRPTSPQLE